MTAAASTTAGATAALQQPMPAGGCMNLDPAAAAAAAAAAATPIRVAAVKQQPKPRAVASTSAARELLSGCTAGAANVR